MKNYVVALITEKNTTGAGDSHKMVVAGERTIQCSLRKTGVSEVTATVYVQVSNDGTNWVNLATFSLNTAGTAADGFALTAPWAYVRGYVHAVSSSSSVISMYMCGTQDEA